jgi:long-chain acyl-CoA synthetase
MNALTGPEAPFQIGFERVLGERMLVFARRDPHLRAVLTQAKRWHDAEYLVFGERRLTYGAVLRQVASTARAFEDKLGVRKGDRVAILAANCPEWIISFWAAVCLGAVPVAMNGWWVGEEIRFALDDCQPKILIGDEKRLQRISGADVPVVSIEHDFARLTAYDPTAALPSVPIDEDDPACILYTSGTTARPKGVVHSHRNIIALSTLQLFHGARMAKGLSPSPSNGQRCALVTNPLFHVSGLYTQVVTFLIIGAKTVWTQGRFDPLQVMQLIERERVTGWSPHGAMGPRVYNHPDAGNYDLSSVVSLGTGGAPVSAEVPAGLRRVFPNARNAFTVGYGLTECTALATMNWGAELEAHPQSAGRPLPTVDLDLVDGEICVRSPLVMKEYFRRPEETAAAFHPGRWLRTGDMGRIEDGRLYVETRKRDLILRGAENVNPVEIEQRLERHPAVQEAAVLGVDHAELGQEVKAVVVCRAQVEARELADWVSAALSYYKVPAHWELRSAPLPRNASGKIMKTLLEPGAADPFLRE